ncbi:MAG: TolC family protein [Planctomycetota bacterium]|nr:TolC family protein [Planctomycetota bacterium]MDA1177326.1 TolC family protein [Planctomycetota bacterium]
MHSNAASVSIDVTRVAPTKTTPLTGNAYAQAGERIECSLENGFADCKGNIVQGTLQRFITLVWLFGAGHFVSVAGSGQSGGSTAFAQTVRLSPPQFSSAESSVSRSSVTALSDERESASIRGDAQITRLAEATPSGEQPLPDPPGSTQPFPDSTESHQEISAAWWTGGVSSPIHSPQQNLGVSLETLLIGALQHSAQIRIISEQPLIRESGIVEAEADFDWVRFLDTRWDDTSDPVSTTLQTGSFNRYRNNQWSLKGGVRRRVSSGGSLEVAQQFGFQNTNSVFFVPNDQGTSRLSLRYTQPFLRGRGAAYNRSLIVLAQLDSSIARDEFSRQLQAHLLDISEAYWTLYLERAGLLQKQRLFDRAGNVLSELERRRELDAFESQILKARAAVKTRGSDLVRSRAAVLNTERKIRLLVNDPSLEGDNPPELVPLEHPPQTHLSVETPDLFQTAIRHRPEVNIAMQKVRAAGVRMQMSKNELLPELNLILETYVAGLRGRTDIPNAYLDQFRTGEPGYGVGLQYEVPVHNRAARARHQQRRLELRQMRSEFELALETIRYEVEVALRDLNASYEEMKARYEAILAAEAEMQQLADRWRLLPGDDRSGSLLLEDLLESQQRVNDAEFRFLHAQLNYSLSQMTIKQAMGTLLEDEQIDIQRICVSDGPMLTPVTVHGSDGR